MLKETEILKKFDVVMNYHLNIYQQGVNIPFDIENWNKAIDETMKLARRGLLNEFYSRVMAGTL